MYSEFKKIARAYSRKAAAFRSLDRFDEALQFYDKALLEDNIQIYKDERRKTEIQKKEKEAQAYINP